MDDEYQRQIWRWCRDQEILERQKERLAIERGKEPYCPVCASTLIKTSKVPRSVVSRFGTSHPYEATVNTCGDCGEEGDFDVVNDPAIEEAFDDANSVGVQEKLARLEAQGFSVASIERVLQLPARSLRPLLLGDRTPTRQEAALVMLLTPEQLIDLDNPTRWGGTQRDVPAKEEVTK
jgi:hypothetical protein